LKSSSRIQLKYENDNQQQNPNIIIVVLIVKSLEGKSAIKTTEGVIPLLIKALWIQ
jgi:hypothetical protein